MQRPRLDKLVSFLTCEWALKERPNGGTVVLVRSLSIAAMLYVGGLVFQNLIDPSRNLSFSFRELRVEILNSFQWFCTIFAGAYAALYARFASQWSYVASVYN